MGTQEDLSPLAALIVLIQLADECVLQQFQWGNDTLGAYNQARLDEAKEVLMSRMADL